MSAGGQDTGQGGLWRGGGSHQQVNTAAAARGPLDATYCMYCMWQTGMAWQVGLLHHTNLYRVVTRVLRRRCSGSEMLQACLLQQKHLQSPFE